MHQTNHCVIHVMAPYLGGKPISCSCRRSLNTDSSLSNSKSCGKQNKKTEASIKHQRHIPFQLFSHWWGINQKAVHKNIFLSQKLTRSKFLWKYGRFYPTNRHMIRHHACLWTDFNLISDNDWTLLLLKESMGVSSC